VTVLTITPPSYQCTHIYKPSTGEYRRMPWTGANYVGWDSYLKEQDRIDIKFSLTNLPLDANVTKVRLYVYCAGAGGAAHETDIHPYGGNGQPDPQTDSDSTAFANCAAGTEYLNNLPDLRTTGDKWFTLGDGESAQACIDVENAKAAVDRFTLGLHEEVDDDPYAWINSALEPQSQLEITYEVPVVWGGSALPQVQMAKTILGAYLPWSKRFPKLMPKIV